MDKKDVASIKKKLEVNEERMSKHWHNKLSKLLVEEEKKIERRKEKL